VVALSGAVMAVGLTTTPAHARVDPIVPLEPFVSEPESCIVPAAHTAEGPCSPHRAPDLFEGGACNLPVVYLGGPPGPCPEREAPPESRIIPIGPTDLSR
jgi:hypothetical protein